MCYILSHRSYKDNTVLHFSGVGWSTHLYPSGTDFCQIKNGNDTNSMDDGCRARWMSCTIGEGLVNLCIRPLYIHVVGPSFACPRSNLTSNPATAMTLTMLICLTSMPPLAPLADTRQRQHHRTTLVKIPSAPPRCPSSSGCRL